VGIFLGKTFLQKGFPEPFPKNFKRNGFSEFLQI